MTQHVNVIIATPGHSVMSGYLRSLLDTIGAISERKLTWAYSNQYSSLVSNAREMTLNGNSVNSLEESRPFKGEITYDKIIWIDSDISWTPEDFFKLYDSDKDIVSGGYLLANGEVTAYKKESSQPYNIEEVKNLTELTKVTACGFGFLAVKSGVFESLTRPWFQGAYTEYLNEDTKKKITFPVTGEDFAWCIRVTQNGYDIWLDPSVLVNHHKMMQLTWDGPRPLI